jgi:outer membrane biosynthesis protein TonB
MSIAPLPTVHAYSRRLAVSLAIALFLHGLLLIIPFHQWMSSNRGEAGGVGGGSLPFVGTLLGSAVVIRAEQVAPVEQAASDAAATADNNAATEVTLTPEANTSVALDGADLAVEWMPPAGSGMPGGTGSKAVAGSLQPLGGGGVELEMAMTPKQHVVPNLLRDIVIARNIKHEEIRLQVLVDTDGSVIDYRVLQSIPACPECTASAIEAAWGLVFQPPQYEGQAVRAWVPWELVFGTERP